MGERRCVQFARRRTEAFPPRRPRRTGEPAASEGGFLAGPRPGGVGQGSGCRTRTILAKLRCPRARCEAVRQAKRRLAGLAASTSDFLVFETAAKPAILSAAPGCHAGAAWLHAWGSAIAPTPGLCWRHQHSQAFPMTPTLQGAPRNFSKTRA